MPNNVSTGYNGGGISLAGAPGSDISLDDLFPIEGAPPAPVVPQVPTTGTNPPQTASQTPPVESQPFLRAGSSVYLTAEEAVRGTEHKDALIAKYRTYLQEQGVDPNELTPIARQEPQATPATPTTPQFKYLNQGKKFYADLSQAVTKQDAEAYERINREYQTEVMQSTLAPYLPIMAESQRQRAIRQVSQELPNFQTFLESPGYKETLQAMPLYADMVGYAERDPSLADKLPQVYKAIYLTHQGMHPTPAVVPTAPNTPPPTNPTGRQGTMNSSTLTPPAPGVDTRNWTTSSEARKQLLADGKARGIGDVDWGSLGL